MNILPTWKTAIRFNLVLSILFKNTSTAWKIFPQTQHHWISWADALWWSSSWPFQLAISGRIFYSKTPIPSMERGNITTWRCEFTKDLQLVLISISFRQIFIGETEKPSKMMWSEKAGQVPRGINTWNISISLNIFQWHMITVENGGAHSSYPIHNVKKSGWEHVAL